ncbi:DUF4276 domain-containing protein [Paracidovorax avenae]|uniref:DUF4276 domain-containing protein n=1 Tax=Paracidovorax avenae (strain ATCC 19860 / DSM 7227 / CCUG 15838 / JCM 20985 / LMG 2117 / NCPPB 1011) TaxID=643561 RepID=F0Q6E8_PARA1|nr:DUF4276 family protein [Paracidovorax avenae]ADX45701.1 hypothetical protein Acav_1783 [Paracidovorax avenae ATCC 19860]AVS61733.1 DUF4276 domain-containing protein [Paracidovorax avenae]AVS70263.1 DUF4276 domain-containing protein [Paracidovorax avenae]
MTAIRQRLLPIVEGEGDERAVPVLLRRILEHHGRYDVQVLKPQRRGELPRVKANFARFFEAAILEDAAVLCVLDFDCEWCIDAEHEERNLKAMAHDIRADHPFEACFIVKEFESLFLCDEATTRLALPAISSEAAFPTDPEGVRDAKGWLSAAQPKGMAYKPTTHQAKIASQLNLTHLAQHSPSFQRLDRAVLNLVQ